MQTQVARCDSAFRPNSHRTRTRNASKWDLLSSMGVFTLHTSNIKEFALELARAHPVWIGPKGRGSQLVVVCVGKYPAAERADRGGFIESC